jgi:alpha-ketoglutarate-dependent taurine dioxygenase
MAAIEKPQKRMPETRRKWVKASGEGLVEALPAQPGGTLPLVLKPSLEGVNLADWAASNRELIEAQLLKHGGLLFRGFNLKQVSEFERFINAVSGEAIEYHERSSPRSRIGGNIYTSTDHPPDQHIFLHNEQSYNLTFPLRIFFFCVSPSERGGETLLADTRKVYARIQPEIREKLIGSRYMYVRNFGRGFGLTWQTAFQTTERSAVELYCREHDIEFEWRGDDLLTTQQVRRLSATHPRTRETVWFNHATFFHVSTLAPDLRRILSSAFGEQDLPNNTYYGDGSPIEPPVMDALREAYLRELVTVSLGEGDVLMLDNMLASHGRAPFVGSRKVVVGMSEPCDWNEV